MGAKSKSLVLVILLVISGTHGSQSSSGVDTFFDPKFHDDGSNNNHRISVSDSLNVDEESDSLAVESIASSSVVQMPQDENVPFEEDIVPSSTTRPSRVVFETAENVGEYHEMVPSSNDGQDVIHDAKVSGIEEVQVSTEKSVVESMKEVGQDKGGEMKVTEIDWAPNSLTFSPDNSIKSESPSDDLTSASSSSSVKWPDAVQHHHQEQGSYNNNDAGGKDIRTQLYDYVEPILSLAPPVVDSSSSDSSKFPSIAASPVEVQQTQPVGAIVPIPSSGHYVQSYPSYHPRPALQTLPLLVVNSLGSMVRSIPRVITNIGGGNTYGYNVNHGSSVSHVYYDSNKPSSPQQQQHSFTSSSNGGSSGGGTSGTGDNGGIIEPVPEYGPPAGQSESSGGGGDGWSSGGYTVSPGFAPGPSPSDASKASPVEINLALAIKHRKPQYTVKQPLTVIDYQTPSNGQVSISPIGTSGYISTPGYSYVDPTVSTVVSHNDDTQYGTPTPSTPIDYEQPSTEYGAPSFNPTQLQYVDYSSTSGGNHVTSSPDTKYGPPPVTTTVTHSHYKPYYKPSPSPWSTLGSSMLSSLTSGPSIFIGVSDGKKRRPSQIRFPFPSIFRRPVYRPFIKKPTPSSYTVTTHSYSNYPSSTGHTGTGSLSSTYSSSSSEGGYGSGPTKSPSGSSGYGDDDESNAGTSYGKPLKSYYITPEEYRSIVGSNDDSYGKPQTHAAAPGWSRPASWKGFIQRPSSTYGSDGGYGSFKFPGSVSDEVIYTSGENTQYGTPKDMKSPSSLGYYRTNHGSWARVPYGKGSGMNGYRYRYTTMSQKPATTHYMDEGEGGWSRPESVIFQDEDGDDNEWYEDEGTEDDGGYMEEVFTTLNCENDKYCEHSAGLVHDIADSVDLTKGNRISWLKKLRANKLKRRRKQRKLRRPIPIPSTPKAAKQYKILIETEDIQPRRKKIYRVSKHKGRSRRNRRRRRRRRCRTCG